MSEDRQTVAAGPSHLLFPGPRPPLTHLGATLLRHVVLTGLRYTAYHLGMPMPVKAPVRIRHLNLSFDPGALERLLSEARGGRAVAGAISAPDEPDDGSVRPSGAAFFHRCRLRWWRRRLPVVEAPTVEATTVELESAFRQQLARCLPALNDALLSEVLGSLARRRRRARGPLPPTRGPEATAFVGGRQTRLDRLGPPDPYRESWVDGAPTTAAERNDDPGSGHRDGRGRFAEAYRAVLDRLRPTLLALGRSSHADGVAGHRDDVFFLPSDLMGDLTLPSKPGWLDGAVLRNRAEYFGLVEAADETTLRAWELAPLHPHA